MKVYHRSEVVWSVVIPYTEHLDGHRIAIYGTQRCIRNSGVAHSMHGLAGVSSIRLFAALEFADCAGSLFECFGS